MVDGGMFLKVLKRFAGLPAVPWVNGAGYTVELVSFEESTTFTADMAAWRLSVARLQRPSTFSRFPNTTRSFVPIGTDVVLRIDGKEVAVPNGTMCRFWGGADVALSRQSARGFAVNLIVRNEPILAPVLRVGAAAGALVAVALSRSPRINTFDLLETGPLSAEPARILTVTWRADPLELVTPIYGDDGNE